MRLPRGSSLMGAESFRGYMASFVAGMSVLGGTAALVFTWFNAGTIDPPRDLALIFGALGTITGGGATFLYMQDASSRASHATERATASAAASQPTVTTGGEPPMTTVTPAEPKPEVKP